MFEIHPIRVLILYGDALVCAGLKSTLLAHGGMQLVESSATLESTDVIVADYAQGLEQLGRLRSDPVWCHRRAPRLLIISSRDSEREIRHALQSGARGYLTPGCGLSELVDAVRAVHGGQRHLGALAACRLADSVAGPLLTERETDVLRLLVEGHGNKAIASRLDIAVGTVKSHLKAVFQKLDAKSRTEVAAVADKRGLLVRLPSVEPAPVPQRAAWAGTTAHGGSSHRAFGQRDLETAA